MTKKLYSTFAMLSLLFMLAVTSVQAQSGGSLEVNIRFDFQVGNKVLPAGEYTVRRLSQRSVLIEGADGERMIAQTPRTIDSRGRAARERLVFHRYGNQYFLAQVWVARDGDGRALMESDAEREAAKAQTLALGGEKPQTIEVVASAR